AMPLHCGPPDDVAGRVPRPCGQEPKRIRRIRRSLRVILNRCCETIAWPTIALLLSLPSAAPDLFMGRLEGSRGGPSHRKWAYEGNEPANWLLTWPHLGRGAAVHAHEPCRAVARRPEVMRRR